VRLDALKSDLILRAQWRVSRKPRPKISGGKFKKIPPTNDLILGVYEEGGNGEVPYVQPHIGRTENDIIVLRAHVLRGGVFWRLYMWILVVPLPCSTFCSNLQ